MKRSIWLIFLAGALLFFAAVWQIWAAGRGISISSLPGSDPVPGDSARVTKVEPSGYWTTRDDPSTLRPTVFKWPSNDTNQTTRKEGGSIVTEW